MMEVVYTFCTSIFDHIFGYLEYILLNGSGNNVPLSASTTVLSMTEIESPERIQIDKNETCRKMQNDVHSPGINNRFKKKETLQKKINFEFGNTEPECYYNNIETLKTAMNSSGLYYGIFYENMKCNETKIIEDEAKKFHFFESMGRDIMGTGKNSTISTKTQKRID
ncbi:uncharacterized protein LOC100573640 [Acyrthosiphon pisum]|uniref:Uncharacterized protein n=1 Tax=Acyrthosiphon pisum TaxID=7029 RepID=A0A8R2A6D0_ACYPI|nr:uncharacterized protein LOC100573640 [Acyrthosiphon pisum]|eukprot:XP_003246622.1 PREDICTED: uncharacterized protein LOC100573640 [Acyrthosiphon pisum]